MQNSTLRWLKYLMLYTCATQQVLNNHSKAWYQIPSLFNNEISSVTFFVMYQPQTIEEVLKCLDEIIAWSKASNSRMGYFAMLYRSMTAAVQRGIQTNLFADAKRMEQLDIVFAKRYLDAWFCYQNKKACSASWKAAFDASLNQKLTVVQHLLLGINTHINLDLGIAAAKVSEGKDIFLLQADFEKINDIIASLTSKTYDALCRLWFPLRFLGTITNNRHDAVVNFSITKARETSWANAVALSACTPQTHENYVQLIDDGVVLLANKIANPGRYLNFLLLPVLYMENKSVAKNIELLQTR